jgi:hypothetical protein
MHRSVQDRSRALAHRVAVTALVAATFTTSGLLTVAAAKAATIPAGTERPDPTPPHPVPAASGVRRPASGVRRPASGVRRPTLIPRHIPPRPA